MIVRDATADMIRDVCLRMREGDRAEIAACTWCETREQMAGALAGLYGGLDGVWCAYWNDVPAVIAFAVPLRPRTLSLGMFATDDWAHVSQHWVRWARRTLIERVTVTAAHRIEVASMTPPGSTDGWFGWFGLEPESTMPNFGKNGETFWLYSRTGAAQEASCSAA